MSFIKSIHHKIQKKKFASNGNLSFGSNTIFNPGYILIPRNIENYLNIEVGTHSNISCNFVLLNPKAKIKIGDRVFIGSNTLLFCYENIEIQDDVMISWGCTLADTNAHSIDKTERLSDVLDWNKGESYKNWDVVDTKPIVIEKQSWIGFESKILKGVIVGEGAVVGAASVVTSSVMADTIVAGNPARFVKNTN